MQFDVTLLNLIHDAGTAKRGRSCARLLRRRWTQAQRAGYASLTQSNSRTSNSCLKQKVWSRTEGSHVKMSVRLCVIFGVLYRRGQLSLSRRGLSFAKPIFSVGVASTQRP